MKCLPLVLVAVSSGAFAQTPERPFQPFHLPQLIEGKTFNLDLHPDRKVFWKGSKGTPTMGYNRESFWGPTLVFKKGETIRLNVKNSLKEPTTTHWHGLHIPAIMDGGPHQMVDPGKTWSPTFRVANNAGTYWYHPHAHESTQNQLTSGAGGLIIIRDDQEAKLKLPRTYGVDDIPLSLTSRRFKLDDKFSFEGDNDKYGDYLLVNGVMDPQITLPGQWVRLRILNAEVERGYILGFSDNRTYYQIATDGGLVDRPVPLKRMKLMVGERTEILVNLADVRPGKHVDLMAFNSNQPFGFPGGEPGTAPPNGGYLNNIDFRILRINGGKKTAKAVASLPKTLTLNVFPKLSAVKQERSLLITADNPGEPFGFDEKLFAMDRVDHVVRLGDTEKWTVKNNRIFGHSFHIHDIQFKIVSRSDGPVEPYEQGWKDTLYVPRDESVSFIARFDDFASNTDAFMYHCHMANHEDGGLMGQFLVVNDPTVGATKFRPKMKHAASDELLRFARETTGRAAPTFDGKDADGRALNLASLAKTKPVVLFFIESQCPCTKEATVMLNRLQACLKDVRIVGVINGNAAVAKAWMKATKPQFSVLPDPGLQVVSAYGAKSAATFTLVAPGGRIAKTYVGYGREMLVDLASRVAGFTGRNAKIPNFADAPKELVVGCPFPK